MLRALASLLVVLVVAASCMGGGGEDEAVEEEPCVPYLPATELVFAGGDVGDCGEIQARFTCDGENVSPALSWTGIPPRTAELALVVSDPDAPDGDFTHWLAYGIEPDATGLPRGIPPGEEASADGTSLLQGENDFGDVGYGGPCPPERDTHRYVFRLIALDAPSSLEAGATRDEVMAAARDRHLADTQLTATYARP